MEAVAQREKWRNDYWNVPGRRDKHLVYSRARRWEKYWNDPVQREKELEYARHPETRERNRVLKKSIRKCAKEMCPRLPPEKIINVVCKQCGITFGVIASEYYYRRDIKGQEPQFHSTQCYGLSIRGKKK